MKAEDVIQYTFNHAVPIQIRYNDIDLAGHVNNGVFHEYFDLGRVYYFDEVLGNGMFSRENHVAIVQSNTTYAKEVFFGDPIQMVSKVIRFGNKSFDFLQAILLESEEGIELCAFTLTTFVCMDYTTHSSKQIPEEWKEKIRIFEKSNI